MTNPVELRRVALEVLVRELGYANAMRFLLQYETGRGDYTRDRSGFLPDFTTDQCLDDAAQLLNRSSSHP